MNLEQDARKTLVLIGAGSAVFSRGLMADLISAPDLGAWDLRLVDTNPDALRVATRLAERMVEADRMQKHEIAAAAGNRAVKVDGHDAACSSTTMR